MVINTRSQIKILKQRKGMKYIIGLLSGIGIYTLMIIILVLVDYHPSWLTISVGVLTGIAGPSLTQFVINKEVNKEIDRMEHMIGQRVHDQVIQNLDRIIEDTKPKPKTTIFLKS